MSEHFGNYWSISIEGCSARFFPNPKNMEVNKKTYFHAHFSYGYRQNVSTTHVHMLVLVQYLMGGEGGVLIEGFTIFDNIDGCAKQY